MKGKNSKELNKYLSIDRKLVEFLPKGDPGALDEMLRGCQIYQILIGSIRLGIFDSLKKPKTADQISKEIGTNSDLTEKFLNALVALKLLSKEDNQYSNTELSDIFLVRNGPFHQGHLIELTANCNEYWSRLRQTLKSGGISNVEESAEHMFDRDFILAHAEGALRGDLQRAVRAIGELSEFKNAKTLLDLGEGHGLYAIAFAQLNPDLEVSVLDLPSVVQITNEFIEKFEMQHRIETIAGDFTKDPLRNKYDVIFASDVNILSDLEKISGSLTRNGTLMYRRWILENGKTSPLTSVLFDLMYSLMQSNHRIHTLEEYRKAFREGGFLLERILDVSTSYDPSRIMVCKKNEGDTE